MDIELQEEIREVLAWTSQTSKSIDAGLISDGLMQAVHLMDLNLNFSQTLNLENAMRAALGLAQLASQSSEIALPANIVQLIETYSDSEV